jgi:hypothetical protein
VDGVNEYTEDYQNDARAGLFSIMDAFDEAVGKPRWEGERPKTRRQKISEEHEAKYGKDKGQFQRDPARYAFDEDKHPRDDDGKFRESLQSLGHGDMRRVRGWMVRKLGDDKYRVDTDAGHVLGNAEKVQKHIDKHHALTRLEGKAYTEAVKRGAGAGNAPDLLSDADAARSHAEKFHALPHGTKVVSLDPETRGRLGTVHRAGDRNRVKLDGEPGYVSDWVEPVEESKSWRKSDTMETMDTSTDKGFRNTIRKAGWVIRDHDKDDTLDIQIERADGRTITVKPSVNGYSAEISDAVRYVPERKGTNFNMEPASAIRYENSRPLRFEGKTTFSREDMSSFLLNYVADNPTREVKPSAPTNITEMPVSELPKNEEAPRTFMERLAKRARGRIEVEKLTKALSDHGLSEDDAELVHGLSLDNDGSRDKALAQAAKYVASRNAKTNADKPKAPSLSDLREPTESSSPRSSLFTELENETKLELQGELFGGEKPRQAATD